MPEAFAPPKAVRRSRRNREPFGALFQLGSERLEQRPLDIDPPGAEADLTAVRKGREHRAFDGLAEAGIGEDQRRVPAAKPERGLACAQRVFCD